MGKGKNKRRFSDYVHYQEKGLLWIYILLRVSVIVILILELINGNITNACLCILTLILFGIPVILDKRFNIELPNALEVIILLFIYAAEILGEIQNFYGIFKNWDTILHTINGFIMAGIGFSMVDILNNSERFHIKLTPIFVALVAFCFSMTIGVLWEFVEYGVDTIARGDMQKDKIVTTISSVALDDSNSGNKVVIKNITESVIYGEIDGEEKQIVVEGGYLDIGLNDTMKDLLVNCLGAIVFCTIGYFYLLRRSGEGFFKQFIPYIKRKKHKLIE